MKTVKLLLAMFIVTSAFTSCYVDLTDDYVDVPAITLDEVLSNYELWYIDIEQTSGTGEIPFMEQAFTLSFYNGTVRANNNLVGFGSQGNGLGIAVGYYDIYDYDLDIYHDIDGFNSFEIRVLTHNQLELYSRAKNTSYILYGYQRNTFDYDRVFYDNIHYFLQEYVTWEKVYTSNAGEINAFDYENFLQFYPVASSGNFRSSQDNSGTAIDYLYWDYEGIYEIGNVAGNSYLKNLWLDYDYFNGEFFELEVIDDRTIALYHPDSGTTYRFRGKSLITYKTLTKNKKRIKQSVIEEEINKLKKKS